MKTKQKNNAVTSKLVPVNAMTNIAIGIIKVANSYLDSGKLALPYKEQWEKEIEGKTEAQISEMASVLVEGSEKALGIVKGDKSPENAVKRAALSKALLAIGIQRRASAPKGEPVEEKHIQAMLTLAAKLEKTDARQRKLVRAVYDRLLKATK
jgi:hypothetical protein